jgi:PilZ domain
MNGRQQRSPAPREPRRILQVRVRYRPAGDETWREGRSENISGSGVLFRAASFVSPETLIEIVLTLGEGVGENSAGTLICRGRVVRIEAGNENDPRAAIAATIACRQSYPHDSDPRRI